MGGGERSSGLGVSILRLMAQGQKRSVHAWRSVYLAGILYVVLLAGPQAHAAAGGGAGLLRAAQHDGVLVEVAAALHRHRHRAGLLAHIVAVGVKQTATK